MNSLLCIEVLQFSMTLQNNIIIIKKVSQFETIISKVFHVYSLKYK